MKRSKVNFIAGAGTLSFADYLIFCSYKLFKSDTFGPKTVFVIIYEIYLDYKDFWWTGEEFADFFVSKTGTGI